MPTNHTVKSGDCIASLTQENGFSDYQTIYNDPANTDLKKNRPNPDVLAVGDVVTIPDVAAKSVSVPTGQIHTLVVTVVPTLFRIRITDQAGVGIAGLEYELEVGAVTFSGTTPKSGEIEAQISAVQKTGTLRLWKKKEPDIEGYAFPLEFGALEHESIDSACQVRLLNLGFDCGGVSGMLDAPTKDALRGFQKERNLKVTGELNPDVRAKLRTSHEGL